eukprot:TRINITY_DN9033_c0_g1::TRINITY_DN9033_c0_g1_i1::g.18187::m.18187 TRINITY_DN9033_c0_g1::TRINITY_DN9033_c0_g1_i1::g.18187  ORF type:complete len:340 (+),score=-8.02,Cyclin/PF08613.6/6.1e-06,Cyclin_N/PF00134.18/0.013 TRINITY_DN9033_c0_g1_i1:166-1185(+)
MNTATELSSASLSSLYGIPLFDSVASNKDLCINFIVAWIDALTNWEYPTLSREQLQKYGMINDPVNLPLQNWLQHLLCFISLKEIILGLIYLRRALRIAGGIIFPSSIRDLTRYNRHRVIYVSAMLAHKFWVDEAYTCNSWVKIGHFWKGKQVANFERKFLARINWRLHVAPKEFSEFVRDANHFTRTTLLTKSMPQNTACCVNRTLPAGSGSSYSVSAARTSRRISPITCSSAANVAVIHSTKKGGGMSSPHSDHNSTASHQHDTVSVSSISLSPSSAISPSSSSNIPSQHCSTCVYVHSCAAVYSLTDIPQDYLAKPHQSHLRGPQSEILSRTVLYV